MNEKQQQPRGELLPSNNAAIKRTLKLVSAAELGYLGLLLPYLKRIVRDGGAEPKPQFGNA
jgi:hypothetical protein